MTECFRPILELSVVFPGVLLAYLPMKHHLRLRPGKLALLLLPLLSMLCLCGGLACWHWQIRTRWVMAALITAVTVLYISTLDGNRWKSLNVALAICAVFACLHSTAKALNALLIPGGTGLWLGIAGGLAYNAMCFAFAGLVWYPATHAVVELQDDEGIAQTRFVFWILSAIFVGLNLFLIPEEPELLLHGRLLMGCIGISLSLLAVLGLFYALFYMTARSMTRNDRLRQENQFLTMQQEHYDNLRAAIEETRHARHDLRHHFLQLSAMAEKGELEGIREYLCAAQSKIPSLEMRFSDNRAVDSVIGHYWATAQQTGIPFQTRIDLPELLPVDEMDACLVLSNLLENALEASEQLHLDKRRITVDAYVHADRFLLICVENTYSGLIREKDGVFRSSKRKRAGVGIQSIRRIAEKNGGDSRFQHEQGLFTAKVMLRGEL